MSIGRLSNDLATATRAAKEAEREVAELEARLSTAKRRAAELAEAKQQAELAFKLTSIADAIRGAPNADELVGRLRFMADIAASGDAFADFDAVSVDADLERITVDVVWVSGSRASAEIGMVREVLAEIYDLDAGAEIPF